MKTDYSAHILLCIFHLWRNVGAEELQYSITKTVEAEQFKYIQIESEGDFRVELNSLHGDADIYASDETESPSFDDYKVKSASCGDDYIYIPSQFSRPVYVGIYGHVGFDQTTFSLQVYSLDKEQDIFEDNLYTYELLGDADAKKTPDKPKKSPGNRPSMSKGDEEEHLLWTIFVGILRIIFDVLV